MNEFVGILLAVVLLPGLTLIGLILQLMVVVQGKKVNDLAAGGYYVNWPIAPQPWSEVMAQREKANSSIPGLFAKWFGGATLFMVAGYYFLEDTVFFDSTILHFLIPTAVVALVSYLAGILVVVFTGMTDRIMRTQPPKLVIGPRGIYMTGTFWPTSTLDQKLVSTEVIEEDGVLSCKYRLVKKHGVEFPIVRYPFPQDNVEEAYCVADLLNDPPSEG